MLKKYAVLMLIGLVVNLTFVSFGFAQDVDSKAAEKAKIKVAKFGVGGRLTEVKLNDNTKIKGYITEIKDDHFVLVNKKTAATTNISYNQMKSIRRTFTTFQKITVGVVGTIGVIFLITGICVAFNGCQD